MTTFTSNTFWNSPDGLGIRLQSLLIKCDFCDEAHDEELVEKIDGYHLCAGCLDVYKDQKAHSEYLAIFTLSI